MNLRSNTIRLPSADGAGKHDRFVVIPDGANINEAIVKINTIIRQANKEDKENGGVCLDGNSVGDNIDMKVAALGFTFIRDIPETVCWDDNYVDVNQESFGKESLANEELEGYDFGEGVTVVGSDGWDKTDPLDFIKVVYIGENNARPDDESEKVSFHVRFQADGSVDDAYGLLVRNGGEIGVRPANVNDMNKMSQTWSGG